MLIVRGSEDVNRLWTETMQFENIWKSDISLDPTRIWKDIINIEQKRNAIFFVDAFRTDIIWTLANLLKQDKVGKIKEHPFSSAIPSITKFGMLLPLTFSKESFELSLDEKKLDIHLKDYPLNSREDRKN